MIDCIDYRHPSMELNDFNNIYLSQLLHIISKENKTILGDVYLAILISIYSNMRKTIPQMSFLINSHQICFYLTFYIQQGSMVNQGLSLITYFQINIIKRQFLITQHLQSLIISHNFFLFHQFFLTSLLLNQISMKRTGPNVTKKILYYTILKKIGIAS